MFPGFALCCEHVGGFPRHTTLGHASHTTQSLFLKCESSPSLLEYEQVLYEQTPVSSFLGPALSGSSRFLKVKQKAPQSYERHCNNNRNPLIPYPGEV